MKIKSLFNLFFISLFFLLNGCNNPKPTFQDFIGTWVSEDGEYKKEAGFFTVC